MWVEPDAEILKRNSAVCTPDLVRKARGVIPVRQQPDDHERITAPAHHAVVVVQTATQHCRNTLQCDIAGLVTEFVVDGFQPVEIDAQQAQAPTF